MKRFSDETGYRIKITNIMCALFECLGPTYNLPDFGFLAFTSHVAMHIVFVKFQCAAFSS